MIKKIIGLLLCLVLFWGCSIDIEDEDSIIISCTPSSATIQVKADGSIDEFFYNFALETGNVNLQLDTITTQYYSDIDLINSRTQVGNFLTLTNENPSKKLYLNLVVPEIMSILETNKAVKATIKFHFTSISGVEKVLNSEISIIKKEEESN